MSTPATDPPESFPAQLLRLHEALADRTNAWNDALDECEKLRRELAEARAKRDNARKEDERFRNVMQDYKWPKHTFSWDDRSGTSAT